MNRFDVRCLTAHAPALAHPGTQLRKPSLLIRLSRDATLWGGFSVRPILSVAWLLLLSCHGLPLAAQTGPKTELSVLTFNILQGGGHAANVGFPDDDFGGSRRDEIAAVIHQSGADLVAIQEDDPSDRLLIALGDDWHRTGSIYAKRKLTLLERQKWLTVSRWHAPTGHTVVVVNIHWSPAPYGPFLIQDELRIGGRPVDLPAFETRMLAAADKSNGPRGYQATLDALQPYLEADEQILLLGDFNEPSHLDWTDAAANRGPDRWVSNPTGIPLRFPIRWTGSQKLAKAGLRDAYRSAYPDEARQPGATWTPPYPEPTAGRRSYADQVLDRIDRIYFHGDHWKLKSAAVVGESAETSEIVFRGRWPSDHRAVLACFLLQSD